MEPREVESATASTVNDDEWVTLYKIALSRLAPLIRVRFGFTHDQVGDVISQTFESLVPRLRHAGSDIENPTAYMYTVALQRAATLGWAIGQIRETPVENTEIQNFGLSDSRTAAAIDNFATVDNVRQVLQKVAASGDSNAFRVLVYMFDGIQITGEVPSNREIGRACGLSHTGVAKVLERLRPYFRKFYLCSK